MRNFLLKGKRRRGSGPLIVRCKTEIFKVVRSVEYIYLSMSCTQKHKPNKVSNNKTQVDTTWYTVWKE